ncbi:DHA2 family efflux MFS transporter permease subunit [Glacieibacterium megasporae]|uniref:DHA2 family efflux MFS transporter permease subunit n=1 Tax=Glacieibacterium megasporae TaxID=2835787 RepID=UPI0021058CA2|nr:DHA2 family efflux MFS transporter permease subunit [Polymorphobacter megasporae]
MAGPGGGGGGWDASRSAAGNRSPWLIVGVISIATFMEVLDTAIANVSLDHIGGSLSVSPDESTWVLTSYLVSNAIIIPISGWLSNVIGRKRYYMLSVVLFTAASFLCGISPNIQTLIIARILQGIGGGGLAPSEQSMLADTFPPAKRGQAFAAYAFVIIVAPVLGPTIGGWVTDSYSWHWIFLINVPVGALSLFLVGTFVDEPKALVEDRKALLKKGISVDWVGFLLVAIGLGSLELFLDRGERDDWFGSGFITATAIVAAVAIAFLVIWETTRKDPIVNLRLMANRNFAAVLAVMFTTGVILFGSTQLIPQMLQQVFHYTATNAGLAMTAGGIATVCAVPIVGRMVGKVDVRLLLGGALLVSAAALWHLTSLDTNASFATVAWSRAFQAVALPFLFVPITNAAYTGLKPKQTSEASSLLNVFRNLGGSVGIAMSQAVLSDRTQIHQSRLVEHLNPLAPNYPAGLSNIESVLRNAGMAAGQAQQAALGQLYQIVQRQASMMGYLDVFADLMIFTLCVAPVVFLLKTPKGGQGGAA